MPAQARRLLGAKTKKLIGQLVAAGEYQAYLDPVGPDEVMVIDGVQLSSNPATVVSCALYLDNISPAGFLVESKSTARDSFSGLITVPGGTAVLFDWTGVSGSPVLTARVHFSRYQLVTLPTDPTLAAWRGPSFLRRR